MNQFKSYIDKNKAHMACEAMVPIARGIMQCQWKHNFHKTTYCIYKNSNQLIYR